mmetsp:Transcript_33048/g.76142  ORF Transcript_33048/g.76142 Transcript_33048/m.76142 type:complete len:95 (-) Transcript_33048:289-573(-)
MINPLLHRVAVTTCHQATFCELPMNTLLSQPRKQGAVPVTMMNADMQLAFSSLAVHCPILVTPSAEKYGGLGRNTTIGHGPMTVTVRGRASGHF